GPLLGLDGIFLLRPELRTCWDYSIFLEVGFDVSIARGAARDHGSPDPDAPENRRYVEGQRLYLRTCEPRRHATVVIDNRDLAAPFIVRPELRVRPATVNDARGIASVQVRAWRAAYAGMVPRDFLDNLSVDEREARWRQNLGGTEAMTCVAEESGGVIGWAGGRGGRGGGGSPCGPGGSSGSRSGAPGRSSCGCSRPITPRGASMRRSASAPPRTGP